MLLTGFRRRASHDVAARPLPEARCRALAERLGRWPLLLSLAVGQIRELLGHGETVEEALAFVEDSLTRSGVTGLDSDAPSGSLDDSSSRSVAFAASIGASLSLLADRDRDAFMNLGILPEDAAIPLATAGQLWDAVDPKRIALRLANVSLIDLSLGDRPQILVHDLVLRFAAQRLREQGRWGDTHRRLVAAWKNVDTAPGAPPWTSHRGDEYFHKHLVSHLISAEMFADVEALFANDRWLTTRVNLDDGDYAGMCDDLAAARDMARQTSGIADIGGVEQAFHYALIRTSINAIARQCPPALVVRAVESGLWRSDRVLNVLSRMPIPIASSTIIHLLRTNAPSPTWLPRLLQLGLQVARSDWMRSRCAQTLAAILPHLPDSDRTRVADEARLAAWEVTRPGGCRDHIRALLALMPQLSSRETPAVLDRAVNVAREEPRPDERIDCLGLIAMQPGVEATHPIWALTLDAVQEQLEELRGAQSVFSRGAAGMLLALVPKAPEALLDRIGALARTLPEQSSRQRS